MNYSTYIRQQSFQAHNKFVYYDYRQSKFVDLYRSMDTPDPNPVLLSGIKCFLGVTTNVERKAFRWEDAQRTAGGGGGIAHVDRQYDRIAARAGDARVVEKSSTMFVLTLYESASRLFFSQWAIGGVSLVYRALGQFVKENTLSTLAATTTNWDIPQHLADNELFVVAKYVHSYVTVSINGNCAILHFVDEFPPAVQKEFIDMFDLNVILGVRKTKIVIECTTDEQMDSDNLYVFADVLFNGRLRDKIVVPEAIKPTDRHFVVKFGIPMTYYASKSNKLVIVSKPIDQPLDVTYCRGILALLINELGETREEIERDYSMHVSATTAAAVVASSEKISTKKRLLPLVEAEPLIYGNQDFLFSQRCQRKRQPRVWKNGEPEFVAALTHSLSEGKASKKDMADRSNKYITEFLKGMKASRRNPDYGKLETYMLNFPSAKALGDYPKGVTTKVYTCIPNIETGTPDTDLIVPRLVQTAGQLPVPCCFKNKRATAAPADKEESSAPLAAVAVHVLGADKVVPKDRTGKLNYFQNSVLPLSITRAGIGSWTDLMLRLIASKRQILASRHANKSGNDMTVVFDLADFLNATLEPPVKGKPSNYYYPKSGTIRVRNASNLTLFKKIERDDLYQKLTIEPNSVWSRRLQTILQFARGAERVDIFDCLVALYGTSLNIWSDLLGINICQWKRDHLWYGDVVYFDCESISSSRLPHKYSAYVGQQRGHYEGLRRSQIVYRMSDKEVMAGYLRFQHAAGYKQTQTIK